MVWLWRNGVTKGIPDKLNRYTDRIDKTCLAKPRLTKWGSCANEPLQIISRRARSLVCSKMHTSCSASTPRLDYKTLCGPHIRWLSLRAAFRRVRHLHGEEASNMINTNITTSSTLFLMDHDRAPFQTWKQVTIGHLRFHVSTSDKNTKTPSFDRCWSRR